MAKKNKFANEQSTIKFKPTPELMLLIQQARQNFANITQPPSIEAQIDDLKLNLHLLNDSPLLKLQNLRLMHHQTFDLENFKNLWFEQLLITKATQFRLDANFIAPKFANADLTRYRLYITQLLFIYLTLSPINGIISENNFDFVHWINGIERAQTTAKVTIRTKPDIQSDILVELPKHAVVSVYQDENPHWKKIRIEQNDQDLMGFVMSAYLKF